MKWQVPPYITTLAVCDHLWLVFEIMTCRRMILCAGDLTHTYPRADGSVNEKYESEVATFKDIWKDLDGRIELVCVCGNHDVGEKPNSLTVESYRGNFGLDYFSFSVNDDRMIIMNSQYYKNDENCKELSSQHEKWFSQELEIQCRHKIVFSHIAPFILHQNEPNAYFNMNKQLREELVTKAIEADVSHWFCGRA